MTMMTLLARLWKWVMAWFRKPTPEPEPEPPVVPARAVTFHLLPVTFAGEDVTYAGT